MAIEFPTVDVDDLAWVDTDQMIEVDRVMIEDLHIGLVQMMENAGRNLAHLTMSLFAPATAAVYVGSGGNGGGAMVAARHLANRGVSVTVVSARPADALAGVPAHQRRILDAMGVPVVDASVTADVALDGLIGYSLRGAPHGLTAQLVEALNDASEPVVSLDVPSGLDASSGATPGVVVDADVTLTLAAPKVGLRGHGHTRRLFVGDISVPPAVYAGLGVAQPAPPFHSGPLLEIVRPIVHR